MAIKEWNPAELAMARKLAVRWYTKHRRDLPWRDTSDPYRIWISEIMLQQTVVATVIPYYHAFLTRFPDVESLAEADEQEVLSYWAGLGYYRRAKQLHRASQLIAEQYRGMFPQEFEQIQSLPGIGRYTAGAIASFAYDQRRPIVEANTQRLFARLLRLKGQLSDSRQQSRLWDFATSVLPSRGGSGQMNQAMMEIGSQLCTPIAPRCTECPLQELCPTNQAGEQDSIPTPKPKKVYEELTEAVLLTRHPKKGYLMRQCQPEERWVGLWDFPRFGITNIRTERAVMDSIQEQFRERFGYEVRIESELQSLKHGVTKYKIHLRCFEGSIVRTRSSKRSAKHVGWFSSREVLELPLSSTGKRLAQKYLSV
jgi:A/G-specific adenine glycosylase